MRRNFQTIVGLAVLWWARGALAQDALTLTQALHAAADHNRSLQSAASSTREAAVRVSQALSAYFPRVSLVESWQRGDQPVFVFSSLLASREFTAANFAIDSLNSPSPSGFFHGAALLEQVIFDGGRTRASVEAARLRHDIAGLSASDATDVVALSTTEAYGRVLSAQAAGRAADAALTAAEEDQRRATLRRDAGSLNEADLLAITVHAADMRQRRIQAAADVVIAKAQLNRLMGAPIDRDYEVEEPAPTALSAAATPAALFAEADTSRPDIQRAAAAERLADTARRQARSSWYPQVAAQAEVEANGTHLGDRASSWIVGGEVRWIFSTGGAERAERSAAVEAASRARIEREDARAAAQVEIVTALQRLESALARQQLAQTAVAQARESDRIIRDRFEAGLAGTNDVLRAAAAVLDAESQRTSALVDALVSRATLDRAIGRTPTVR